MNSVQSNKSGSVYPDKSILKQQLNPAAYGSAYYETEFQSALVGTVNVWAAMANDINRYTINYNEKPIVSPYTEGEEYQNPTSEDIFDEFLLHGGQDIEKTRSICHILEQYTTQTAMVEVMETKGKPFGEGGAHFITNKNGIVVIEDDNVKSTKVIQERLYQIGSRDNPEEGSTYFKAKVIVSGKPEDFKDKASDKLDFKVIYTKEYPTMEAARKADYLGIWAAGFSDRATYIH